MKIQILTEYNNLTNIAEPIETPNGRNLKHHISNIYNLGKYMKNNKSAVNEGNKSALLKLKCEDCDQNSFLKFKA